MLWKVIAHYHQPLFSALTAAHSTSTKGAQTPSLSTWRPHLTGPAATPSSEGTNRTPHSHGSHRSLPDCLPASRRPCSPIPFGPIIDAGLVDPVETDMALAGEVLLRSTPGHTAKLARPCEARTRSSVRGPSSRGTTSACEGSLNVLALASPSLSGLLESMCPRRSARYTLRSWHITSRICRWR